MHVLSTEDAAPLAPTPQQADLDALVTSMEAAGLRIETRSAPLSLVVAGVPLEVAVALVRIAAEALANVLRHRGPGLCWLDVARGPTDVTLSVEDDGPTPWTSDDAVRHVPGHYGLTGMRERAESCGGRLAIGPSARGGWKVCAVLPVL